jgi:hypothetical protein
MEINPSLMGFNPSTSWKLIQATWELTQVPHIN